MSEQLDSALTLIRERYKDYERRNKRRSAPHHETDEFTNAKKKINKALEFVWRDVDSTLTPESYQNNILDASALLLSCLMRQKSVQ